MKLLIVDNRLEYFSSHRRPLASAARSGGYDVHVAALTWANPGISKEKGYSFHALARNPKRRRLLREVSALANLRRLLREIRPDVCHFITLRAVFHGLLALASGAPRPRRVVCSVTGLGYLFTDGGVKARVGREIVGKMIGFLRRITEPIFIFQNEDDRFLFARRGWVPMEESRLVRGSGVETQLFSPSEISPGIPVVLFCARYLRHKGLLEFVEAARMLKQANVEARFVLMGGVDADNPASVSQAEIDALVRDGVVEDWGFCTDMPERLRSSSLVVLPSYREGLPKVILEAASTGRAVITTDVPGCREAIRNGETGILIPARDPIALASAIGSMINDPARLRSMGQAGRKDVEERFSSGSIAAAIIDIYEQRTKVS